MIVEHLLQTLRLSRLMTDKQQAPALLLPGVDPFDQAVEPGPQSTGLAMQIGVAFCVHSVERPVGFKMVKLQAGQVDAPGF